MFRSKKIAVLVAGAVAALALGSFAFAAIPDGGGVIHGCYKNDTGAMRVTDSDTNLPKGCNSKETALNWNQQGPKGDRGPSNAYASHGSVARLKIAPAATLGLAAGVLFSGGDLSAKLVVYGGIWLVLAVPLVGFYALGSIQLQGAFQHGAAVTAAGIATLATNAIPIAAGVVLFNETLPGGASRVLQIVSFGLVVAGAVLLSQPRARHVTKKTN